MSSRRGWATARWVWAPLTSLLALSCSRFIPFAELAPPRCGDGGTCALGYVCRDGICVSEQEDGSAAHRDVDAPDDRTPRADAAAGDVAGAPDRSPGDSALPDRPLDAGARDVDLDGAAGDHGTDAAGVPDHTAMEGALPDHAAFDSTAPDRTAPDLAVPDLATPDLADACQDPALSFSGEQLVTVADSPSLDGMVTMAVEAWIYPIDLGVDAYLVSHHDGSLYQGYALWIFNGRVVFGLLDGSSWLVAPEVDGVGRQLETGRWQHVAGVFDGATVGVFVDGVLQAFTSGGARQAADRSGPLTIGAASNAERGFRGLIDEVRISDAARYIRNFRVPAQPLSADGRTRALWHFDESGGEVLDASGNSNHGFLGRSAVVEPIDPVRLSAPCISARLSDPPTCDDIYGDVDRYIRCGESPDSCTFYVWTGGSSCTDVCGREGGDCLAAFENGGEGCFPDYAIACGFVATDRICTCSRP